MDSLDIKTCLTDYRDCDETCLLYIVKSNGVITAIKKPFVYKITYADKGESHTLLECTCLMDL